MRKVFNTRVYALYKGDTFADMGTLQEMADRRGIKPETLYYYSMPAQLKRIKRRHCDIHHCFICVNLEADDEKDKG